MNVEIGTETPIFLFWEYLFRNFGILSLQCVRCGKRKQEAVVGVSLLLLHLLQGINDPETEENTLLDSI
jgi:hypothetical protein